MVTVKRLLTYQVDLTEGKWLILTRTVSRLLKIEEQLKKKNLYFESNEEKRQGSGIQSN
ncbi:MAG: hypothetical protein CM15mV60_010 [uncultured marine virus]|nr:MAG: hypothetical protein CM15mV60_010 [uncultured marine virus]